MKSPFDRLADAAEIDLLERALTDEDETRAVRALLQVRELLDDRAWLDFAEEPTS